MSDPTSRGFAPSDLSVSRFRIEGQVKRGPVATHEYVALGFQTGGRASIVQNGVRLELSEGDVMLVPAGEPHRLEAGRDFSSWGLGFCAACYAPTDLAPLLEPFERARAGASPVVHISAARQQHLEYLFAELHGEVNQGARSAHTDLVQRSLLGLILSEVKRAAAFAPASEPQQTVVGAALQFIELHCLESISLRDVAEAVRRSPAHVTTMLRKATGKSAVQWITAGRMAEARRRLTHSDEMVDVIAERVGYADTTHFIRTFRRAHGATPAAWRSVRRRSSVRLP